MAERDDERGTYRHPISGPTSVDLSCVAIRWSDTAGEQQKRDLIEGLKLVQVTGGERTPTAMVTATAGLWWVRRADGKPFTKAALEQLEASQHVSWISPLLVGAGDREHQARFTVDPTRILMREVTFARAADRANLPGRPALDSTRQSRIPGYVAVSVDGASIAAGRSVFDVVEELTAALAGDASSSVRFEHIPYLSPTCKVCVPPTREHVPNDPMFSAQWGLQRINASRAWEIGPVDPRVTVAVIDEGVELTHPDLRLHPLSWNASTDTPDGSPTGDHGTACAGIVGAVMDNSQGVAGVAGGVQIMAIATATWSDVDIAEGLYFATDSGAHIVSMSFGVYPWWGVWDFDLIRDALQHAHDAGLVLIAASGNEDIADSRFPGSDARTICIGGSNRDDERKRFGDGSGEGWGACYGPALDVVAPCLQIPTTDRLGGMGYDAGDYFDRFNGTSAATPHVAGLAALMLSVNPSLSNTEVRSIIESTCDKISPGMYAYAHVAGKPSGTWNDEVGYGRINAERAVLAACSSAAQAHPCDCDGCGGACGEETPAACLGPSPVPWLPHDRCMFFYEGRSFRCSQSRERLQIRVLYEHCLRLVGRQQGPLLYTTTLLPGETVELYEYDRYRRIRSESERVSVQTSFRQTLSALSQTRRLASASAYVETLASIRAQADASASAGGGLLGFFGGPTVESEVSVDTETTIASGSSLQTVSDQFSQIARTASQSVEAERTIIVSSFEDAEHQQTTRRRLSNDNACKAVTYYVRRVNEAYAASSRVAAVEWRVGDGPWRSIDDLGGVQDRVVKELRACIRNAPRPGEESPSRSLTVPTDGTAYEAELAHCSSCEPSREAEIHARLEQLRLQNRRACLETELLALEVERRRSLGSAGATEPLQIETWAWSFDRPALAQDHDPHQ